MPENVEVQVPASKQRVMRSKTVENVLSIVLSSTASLLVIVTLSSTADFVCEKSWDLLGLTMTAFFLVAFNADPNEENATSLRTTSAVISGLFLIVIDALDLFNVEAYCKATPTRVTAGMLAGVSLLVSIKNAIDLIKLRKQRSTRQNESEP